MDNSSAIGGLLLLGMIAFIWLLPIFSILFSRKTSGGEKLAWLLAVLFVSWFAWIFYLLLAPISKKV
ncbi:MULTISPECIES: PLDc N-terminal domain-containing protein [Chryseobacterium]|uniref:PLDc N-terminal domain-containing protein n=1 Tax=Chryseobacterium TaxID=59732 RepID=UPI001F1837B2|nr:MULTISPECIES: PLDc N-terminal domain-containing protein [Chryseobacterium]